MFSPLEQFDVIFYLNKIFKFPILNIMFPLLVVLVLFSPSVFFVLSNLKLVPTPLQRIFELIVEFIFNLIKQQIGKDGYIHSPFIFTLFNFIPICNLLSLIPFGIALTSHIIMII